MPNCWIYVTLPRSKNEFLTTAQSDRKCISKNYFKTVLRKQSCLQQGVFAILDETTFHTYLHYYFFVSLVSYKQRCDFSTEKGKLASEILKLWLYQHTVETHDRHFSWNIQNNNRQHASVAGSNTVFLLVLTKRIQALHVLNSKSTFLFPAQILKARQFSNSSLEKNPGYMNCNLRNYLPTVFC